MPFLLNINGTNRSVDVDGDIPLPWRHVSNRFRRPAARCIASDDLVHAVNDYAALRGPPN
jgi:hypothetical protein